MTVVSDTMAFEGVSKKRNGLARISFENEEKSFEAAQWQCSGT